MPLENDVFKQPTQAVLENNALKFVKTNKAKYYNDLRKTNRLKEYCQHRATKAMTLAKDLISGGMPPAKAWETAIREVILEKNH